VNCIVLATVSAVETGITKKNFELMPLVTVFGSKLEWALKDAIAYSGGYDQMYGNHFGFVAEESRGRNNLNKNGPQIHSFPGLSR